MNILSLINSSIIDKLSFFFHSDLPHDIIIGIIEVKSRINKDLFPYAIRVVSRSEIKESDWDVVLVDDLEHYVWIKSLIRSKPIIFIAHTNDSRNQCFAVKNLYRVIVSNSTIRPSSWGIPDRIVSYLSFQPTLPVIMKKRSRKSKYFKIAYIINENDSTLATARKVLSALNLVTYCQVIVLGTEENKALLLNQANPHIRFLDKDKSYLTTLYSVDAVLASGEDILNSLRFNIPSIVLGEKGIGGLVTTQNYGDFDETNFQGRVGGAYNEDIPFPLLDFEIKLALELEEYPFRPIISQATFKQISDRFNKSMIATFKLIVFKEYVLYKRLKNNYDVLKLKPHIVVNINVSSVGSQYNSHCIITNLLSNKIIGSLDKAEASVIEHFNGINTINTILGQFDLFPKADILSIVHQLWGMKVITFS